MIYNVYGSNDVIDKTIFIDSSAVILDPFEENAAYGRYLKPYNPNDSNSLRLKVAYLKDLYWSEYRTKICASNIDVDYFWSESLFNYEVFFLLFEENKGIYDWHHAA